MQVLMRVVSVVYLVFLTLLLLTADPSRLIGGGGPFTKDISYCKGFIMIYNFLRTAIRFGRPELIPFLFAGKVTLEDLPVLCRKQREGVVDLLFSGDAAIRLEVEKLACRPDDFGEAWPTIFRPAPKG